MTREPFAYGTEGSKTELLRLTPAEIRDQLPEALWECAMGTYQPPELWDTAAKTATHGPRVDATGQLGKILRTTFRGWACITAVYPDLSRCAWATMDEGGDTWDTGTKRGGMTIRDAHDLIEQGINERGEA